MNACTYIYIHVYRYVVYIHKCPGGPKTVLVKAGFFLRMSLALWRSANLFLKIFQKMDTKNVGFSRFTTVTAHFHRKVFVEAEKQHFFVRKCVLMLQSSSAASWHCGLCTSIAKTWRTVASCAIGVDNNALGS